MPTGIRRLLGWILVLLSVYFVAVIVYSTTQLAQGATEFRPWMVVAMFFGFLAYISGRFGWRMAKKSAPPPTD